MRFPLSWIGEYVDLPGDPGVAAEAFTLSGSEVEGMETLEGETVCEFGITVNRPDCMNVFGLAREASVLFGTSLTPPPTECPEEGPPVSDLTSVTVEAADLCPRYAARVILGARVGQSPPWMQKRLLQCGLRPINAVVDATNYVLLELGHPLHAFDLDRLEGRRIVVRRGAEGEKITTLDGVERTLGGDHLVIADAMRPAALAGVMGGEDTGVTALTQSIFLEGAVFDPVNVRWTSKRMALHTDASHRFERGVDWRGPEIALDRCARLVLETCGGVLAKGRLDVAAAPPVRPPVRLRHARLEALVGIRVAPRRCEEILRSLGFGVERVDDLTGAVWEVAVPSFRVDVSREADLIEEVVRIRGLSDLPSDLPQRVDPVGGRPAELSLEERLRDAFSTAGFREAVHMSMTDPALEAAVGHGPARALANPLSPQASVLRTTLMGPLCAAVARNRARGQRRLALFEVGRVYSEDPEGLGERRRAAAVLYSDDPPARWGDPEPPGLLHLKGRVDAVLGRLGFEVSFVAEEGTPFHPGLSLAVLCEGRPVGRMGSLSGEALEAVGLKSGALHAAELNLDAFGESLPDPSFRPLSRFPAVTRDFTFLLETGIAWGRVESLLLALDLPLLAQVRFVDAYEGKGIPQGRKAVTFSLVFQSMDRTLSDADVAPVPNRVTGALQEAFGAVLR
ncbi:MAG: phenylalanine--tRNA ligase subunit beta [Acidobacteriota bacterium]